jgi:hypothetical protein
MKPAIKKAILGGIVGTVMMTLMMIGRPMDIAALIGGMMGDNYMIGMVMHIMMGVVLFPVVYVFVVFRFVPGPAPVRGIIWGAVLWLAAATMIMPMAGAGFFMSEIGGMKAAVAALMGHIVYGALLGALAGGVENETTVTA